MNKAPVLFPRCLHIGLFYIHSPWPALQLMLEFTVSHSQWEFVLSQLLCMHAKSFRLCLTLLPPHGLQPTRLFCPWDSPGKNTGVACHALLQRIFLTQGSNSCLLYLLRWQQVLYTQMLFVPNIKHSLEKQHQGRLLEWSTICPQTSARPLDVLALLRYFLWRPQNPGINNHNLYCLNLEQSYKLQMLRAKLALLFGNHNAPVLSQNGDFCISFRFNKQCLSMPQKYYSGMGRRNSYIPSVL